jgi:hypothetical protein
VLSGLLGYGLLLYFLWGYLMDERMPVAVAGLVAILAIFPIGTACGYLQLYWRQSDFSDLHTAYSPG